MKAVSEHHQMHHQQTAVVLSLVKAVLLIAVVQGLRIALLQLVFTFVSHTSLSDTVANCVIMLVFAILIIIYARRRKFSLQIFNLRTRASKVLFGVGTGIVAFLIVSTPFFTEDFSVTALVTLLYSAVATPLFEELLFRGLIWNRLTPHFHSEFRVYLATTVLFGIWHIGYLDGVMFNMLANGLQGNIPWIMFMKVVVGIVYGIIVGFVRYKTKSVYLGMLMHGLMNLFGK
jgi:membrane protease YdiL (CAAX protease family)